MRIVRRIDPWMPASIAVFAAVSLLAPWARSGRVDRSTIELLSTAGALDLLAGWAEVVALVSWYLVPLLAAGAAVAAGWQRQRLTAGFVLPIGPLMGLAWLAVLRSPLETRWGAGLGVASGLMASTLAGLLLMRPQNSAEGH
jgi:hypothetical protein